MNKRKEKIACKQTPLARGTLTGRLHIARNGAGFLVDPATDEAIWIEVPDLGTALPDDVVTIKIIPPGRNKYDPNHPERSNSISGRIVRIDERAPRSIVGTVASIGRFVRVQPLNPQYRQQFVVPSANGAKIKDRVVMKFVRWSSVRMPPEGEITDIIGPADNPSLDTISVMKQFDLPEAFPVDVLQEAEHVSSFVKEPGKRLDLRKKFIFTCDPASARDFDDALSLEYDGEGRRILGVHIADVSHFVRKGSVLDKEAYKRSTSVYLVDKVIPMLPEQLSNGVCSLVPNEDRLAFSTFLTYDKNGNCVERKFAKSIIRSKVRFCYEEVMALISGEKVETKGTKKAPVVAALKGLRGAKRAAAVKTVLDIHSLAQQLRKRRFADGALDMDVPEAEIVLNEKQEMTGVVVRPYDESHQLVEECMVAANEAVAKELWTRGIKILTRLHEPPDMEKLEDLRANLAKLGISTGDLSVQKNLARFLKKIKSSTLADIISVMVLRSMKRAMYSSEKIGHFGLAKQYYAHFTSPIRRYPDLSLHRQLASFLAGKGGKEDASWLARTALNTTECEQVADDAERALTEIKKFRFLEAQLSSGKVQVYDAVIARCTHYGMFVDLPDLVVGGMIHISQISNSYVRFDEFRESLVAGNKEWKVGDKIKVLIKEVDFNQRKLDFIPAKKR